MPQYARPDSDVTVTSFTNGFAAIDETPASDADFAYGANNTAAELEVGLGNVTDPGVSTGHIFRYRIAKTKDGVVDGAGNEVTVTARLMQGTTQIATDTAKVTSVLGNWDQYAYTLSGAEADAITDYADLRLEFVTSASGGSPANRRGGAVSWAELEVPSAGTTYTQGVSGGLTFSASFTRLPIKSFSGGLTFSGSLAKLTSRALAGGLSFAGSLAKETRRALAGGLSFSGDLTASKVATITFNAALTFSGSLARETRKALSGALTFLGELSTNFIPGGGGPQTYLKSLSGELTFSGSLARQTVRSLAGGLTFAGALSKLISKPLTGSLSFLGSLGTYLGIVYMKALAGTLSFAGVLTTLRQRIAGDVLRLGPDYPLQRYWWYRGLRRRS